VLDVLESRACPDGEIGRHPRLKSAPVEGDGTKLQACDATESDVAKPASDRRRKLRKGL
jgi:hypothetical protein